MKLEIDIKEGRGAILVDGVAVRQCTGADVKIRCGEPTEVTLFLSVVGLRSRLDPAEIATKVPELEKAIEILERMQPVMSDAGDELLRCLLTMRAGLGAIPRFSRLSAENVGGS
jgi:hypothetical protein